MRMAELDIKELMRAWEGRIFTHTVLYTLIPFISQNRGQPFF